MSIFNFKQHRIVISGLSGVLTALLLVSITVACGESNKKKEPISLRNSGTSPHNKTDTTTETPERPTPSNDETTEVTDDRESGLSSPERNQLINNGIAVTGQRASTEDEVSTVNIAGANTGIDPLALPAGEYRLTDIISSIHLAGINEGYRSRLTLSLSEPDQDGQQSIPQPDYIYNAGQFGDYFDQPLKDTLLSQFTIKVADDGSIDWETQNNAIKVEVIHLKDQQAKYQISPLPIDQNLRLPDIIGLDLSDLDSYSIGAYGQYTVNQSSLANDQTQYTYIKFLEDTHDTNRVYLQKSFEVLNAEEDIILVKDIIAVYKRSPLAADEQSDEQ